MGTFLLISGIILAILIVINWRELFTKEPDSDMVSGAIRLARRDREDS